MKSPSNQSLRFYAVALLAVSLSLLAYALYDFYQKNYAHDYALRPLAITVKNQQPPQLPDISGYTIEALTKMIPPTKKGNVEIVKLSGSKAFENMSFGEDLGAEVIVAYAGMQADKDPVGIEIKSGVYTLQSLVNVIANPNYIEQKDTIFTLKVPLFIHPEATLIVKGQKGQPIELRLAEDSGSFVSVYGNFYMMDVNVIGWSLSQNGPSTFVDREKFRPFFLFSSDSKAYVGRSSFRHLGYSFRKSYGLTFSTSIKMLQDNASVPRPTGWLIDNIFEDLYYGFYSYEADDVVVIGNEYKNNIIYGIDPHDRSRRLIIANNNAYGTKKKHGIIFSREVNNSWIFNNHSHHNQGSGIMLDRNCTGNVIANNQVDFNENDGVVFIESPNNKSYANIISNNGRSGVRIRNSWDIILMNDKIFENNGYAMLVYQAELKARDVQMDPYAMHSSFDMIGAELSSNTAGNISMMNIERAGFYNISVLKSPGGYFEGDRSIKNLQSQMYDLSSSGQNGTEIYQLNYVPEYSAFWDVSKQNQ